MKFAILVVAAALGSAGVTEPAGSLLGEGKVSWPESRDAIEARQLATFRVPGPGEVRIEALIDPWCRCGGSRAQYFIFQHRQSADQDWITGLPREMGDVKLLLRPDEWLNGKRAWKTYVYQTNPNIEKYEFRILGAPNYYWVDSGWNQVPAQSLEVTIRFKPSR